MTRAEEIAEVIKSADYYDMVIDECKELCELAGLKKEWKEADGDTFERVLYEAARKLEVELS